MDFNKQTDISLGAIARAHNKGYCLALKHIIDMVESSPFFMGPDEFLIRLKDMHKEARGEMENAERP